VDDEVRKAIVECGGMEAYLQSDLRVQILDKKFKAIMYYMIKQFRKEQARRSREGNGHE